MLFGRGALSAIGIAVLIAIGCTPIRPLDVADAGASRIDAAVGHDAGTVVDAAVDAFVAPVDASTDGGCGGRELCNGLDDDCNPATPDGSADPAVGVACDGTDVDACAEGTMRCNALGALACSDTTGDTPEVCGGTLDEDCDGSVDEAGATGGGTYYVDADHDGYGVTTMPMGACAPRIGLAATGGDCDDADLHRHPMATELCNAIDDDCDSMIDDGNPCSGCMTLTNAGRTYQLCGMARPWDPARTSCMGFGYDLARIETAAEQSFVAPLATGGGIASGVWIGLRGDLVGVFRWTDGTVPTYTAWASGEPNLTSSCVRLRNIVGGQWADTDCAQSQLYLCEAP